MDIQRTSRVVIVNGVIALLVGVLMMLWPVHTADVIVQVFAVWLALIAIAGIVLAPRGGRSGALIGRSIVMILLAALIFISPTFFATFVTIMAGMAIIFFGVLGIATSMFIRRLGIGAWWVVTIIGIAGIVLGGFFLFAPQAGAAVLTITLAVFVAIVGIAFIALGWRLRKLEHRIQSDPNLNRRGDDGGPDVISGEIID